MEDIRANWTVEEWAQAYDAAAFEMQRLFLKWEDIPWQLIEFALMIAAPTTPTHYDKLAPLDEWLNANKPEKEPA